MGASSGLDLAIVSSPLQYINAVEWRASVGQGPCDLVLIGDRHDGRARMQELMRRHAPWREVFEIGRRPRPPRAVPRLFKDLLDVRHRAALDRLARRLGPRDYARVAFGDYRNVSQRLLVDRLGRDDVVLLDDGSVTPQAAAFRADPSTAPEPRQFDLGWFRTSLARRLFGDDPPPDPRAVTFFTIYGSVIADRIAPTDRIARNGYGFWRGRGRPARRAEVAWLIGADHGEAGICTPQDYRALVLAAARALRAEGRGSIVYRPHRGQSESVAAALAHAAGMTFVGSTTPVELVYLEAAERPATVAVFASSAADTLAAIDPDLDIALVALPKTYLRKRGDHIRAVVATHSAFNPRLRLIQPNDADAKHESRAT